PKSPNRGPEYPAVGAADDPSDPRIAIAYTTPGGLDVVTVAGATLSSPSHVFQWPATVGGSPYLHGYGPAVVPYGTDRIAVAGAGVAGAPHPPAARGAPRDTRC